MSKALGRASYSAYRQYGVLYIVAEGTKPNLQTKIVIEEQPIRIFPPQFALFFETPGIMSPMEMPFLVEKAFPAYPFSAKTVTILDAAGDHILSIEHRDAKTAARTGPTSSYCVFQQIFSDRYVIALCDAILPTIYRRVFGPASHQECEQYVASHSASAPISAGIASPIKVNVASFKAWIDDMPVGQSSLIVTGEVELAPDINATLVRAIPQGINPAVLLLHIELTGTLGASTAGAFPGGSTTTLRYEESPPKFAYTDTTITGGAEPFTISVDHTS
jgi:hypothetical protein